MHNGLILTSGIQQTRLNSILHWACSVQCVSMCWAKNVWTWAGKCRSSANNYQCYGTSYRKYVSSYHCICLLQRTSCIATWSLAHSVCQTILGTMIVGFHNYRHLHDSCPNCKSAVLLFHLLHQNFQVPAACHKCHHHCHTEVGHYLP